MVVGFAFDATAFFGAEAFFTVGAGGAVFAVLRVVFVVGVLVMGAASRLLFAYKIYRLAVTQAQRQDN
jgi:hypothetical protein